MSPILFSLYVNDFEMHFLQENCPSIDIQLINLFLLMYVHDRVIMSEIREGLHNMLRQCHTTQLVSWDSVS